MLLDDSSDHHGKASDNGVLSGDHAESKTSARVVPHSRNLTTRSAGGDGHRPHGQVVYKHVFVFSHVELGVEVGD